MDVYACRGEVQKRRTVTTSPRLEHAIGVVDFPQPLRHARALRSITVQPDFDSGGHVICA